MHRILEICKIAVAFGCLVVGQAKADRVVTIGGDVTEIAFALQQGGRIVGVDQTSVFPAQATVLPQVGYLRNLSAEGILSLKPDLIIAGTHAGPPAVLEQIASAKIRLVTIHADDSLSGVYAKIDAVAAALGQGGRALDLKRSIEKKITAVTSRMDSSMSKPRAMFLLAQGPGGTLAAGKGTAADAMINLAHGQNVASGMEGYKPLTPESALSLAPDVIIVAEHAVHMMGGLEKLRSRPEIAVTPAASKNRIVVMDAQLLLGFGPRTPDALEALFYALHPTASK